MAIVPIREGSIIPKDGVLWLSKQEAVNHQKELIKEWEPASEVLPLKYGTGFLAIGAGLCGLSVNSLFRRKLKLGLKGQFITSLCFSVGPGVFAHYLHDSYVKSRISIYEKKCPICLELKASILQNCTAILIPLLTAPIINIGIAAGLGLRVPHLSQVAELCKFWWTTVKPASTHFAIMCAFNVVLAGFITEREYASMENIADILLKVEKNSAENQIRNFHTID